jgi:hypothetical protein
MPKKKKAPTSATNIDKAAALEAEYFKTNKQNSNVTKGINERIVAI